MIDSQYLVQPGKKLRLKDHDSSNTGDFKEKQDANGAIDKNKAKIIELQEVLYAQASHAMLIIFQAMDAGGKDGAIDFVFSGVNPQGCQVTSFKVPTSLERAHDFLWRHHEACPPKGMIGIHNRSHYESVLVERVHEIAPKKIWADRYDHINAFESVLADEGTTILKFFLNISRDEQKERMEARLKDPAKNWKFNPNDLKERELWDDYMDAYDDALEKCSTKKAPWYVVPSNKKWFRNFVISDIIRKTMESLDMKFPEPIADVEKIVVPD